MINVKEKTLCCGCEACINVCPQKCIQFKYDDEGFGYPEVEKKVCVNCGLCEKACPMDKSKVRDDDLKQAYIGAWDTDSLVGTVSSGGIFSAVASHMLSEGGVVAGAAFNDDFRVNHMICQDKKNLILLSGSKYVQSRIGNVYVQISEMLHSGKKVLFCGTPCQVYGLLNTVGENENLYTIDLVCRAVPSPMVWEKYFELLKSKYGDRVKTVRFRDKSLGYQFSHFAVYDDQQRCVYRAGTYVDQYLRAFFSGICNRPSCYECKFKTTQRKSDITLGDCFFSQKFGISANKGVNGIWIHSSRGKELLEKSDVLLYPVDYELLSARSFELTNCTPIDPERKSFFADLLSQDFQIVLDHYFPITFKHRLNYKLRRFLKTIGLHDWVKAIALHTGIIKWIRKYR